MPFSHTPAPTPPPQPDSGGDWPQWRGPDGMGTSSASPLPTTLAPDSPELVWRTDVPGDGISSPAVVGEKVFLTTAYPGEMGGGQATLRTGIPLLALLALVLLLVRRRSEGQEQAAGTPRRGTPWRMVGRLDGLLLALGTLVFGLAANLANFRPGLFYEPGSPGYRWFWTGAIAFVGLALAGLWFRPRSPVRFLVLAALALAAVYLYRGIPPNRYAESFRAQVRLLMLAPGLALAGWQVLAWTDGRASAPRSLLVAALGALSLVASSGALFVLTNLLVPKAGLVRAVLCFDLGSGELLWNTPVFVAPEEKKYPKNSYATPTPCATEDTVFAHFGAGYVALDHDGEILWQSVDEDFENKTRYGASTSPILFEDSVIYQHDKELDLGPSYAQRLRLSDGEELWHADRGRNNNTYSTPLLVERGDEPEVITLTFDKLYGYDPRTGKQSWTTEIPIEQMVPSIVLRGDLLLVSGGSHLKDSANGLRITGRGKDTKVEVLWQNRRAVPAISSPVLIGDCYVMVTDGGIMTCYDPENGDIRWQERLTGAYWSSLVAGDGKIWALNDEGLCTTVRAGPEFEVLAQGDFASPCYATPAIAHGRVLVRTEHELYCFGAER